MNIEFYAPEYLYGLLLVAVLLGLSIWSYYRRRQKLEALAPKKEMRDLLAPDRVGRKRLYRDVFFLLALSALLVALSRPRSLVSGNKDEDLKGIELVFCFDVSNSMLCPDIALSRIDFAKKTVSTLLDDMPQNKVAIIAFAQSAYVQLPLTTDMLSAQEFLHNLSPDILSAQGTYIGEAIRLAQKSFSSQKDIGKAIVLLTDGEDFEKNDNALEAARNSAKAGVSIHVVGVGTKEGGLIPLPDGTYLKDDEGKPVTTYFNPDLGRAIAKAGSGSFVSFNSSKAVVSALERQLEELPKANISTVKGNLYKEYFVYWLGFALLVLLAEYFILERRNGFFRKYKLFNDED